MPGGARRRTTARIGGSARSDQGAIDIRAAGKNAEARIDGDAQAAAGVFLHAEDSRQSREESSSCLPNRSGASSSAIATIKIEGATPSSAGGNKANSHYLSLEDHPEDLKRVKNLPERNKHFSGREDLLTRIHDGFFTHQINTRAITHSHTICGAGGIGKTELALEYAHLHSDQYDFIYWINASGDAIYSSMCDLAKIFSIAIDNDNIADWIAILHYKISKIKTWLLVFDNADCREDITRYLPKNRSVGMHILITSRNQVWQGNELVQVDPFEKIDATKYLRARLPGHEDTDYLELAVKLDYYPLALRIAAAACETKKLTIRQYLNFLEERGVDYLDKKCDRRFVDDEYRRYPVSIVQMFSVAVNEIAHDVDAANLLYYCAYLNADHIPLEMFSDERLIGSHEAVHDAVAKLCSYSLLQTEGSSYTDLHIHRLLQEVMQRKKPDEKEEELICVLETLVDALIKYFEIDTENIYTRKEVVADVVPHLRSILGHYKKIAWGLKGEQRIKLANAYILMANIETSDLSKQKENFQSALTLYELELNIMDKRIGRLLTCFSLVLEELNEYERATTYLERALKIFEDDLENNLLELAEALILLCKILAHNSDKSRLKQYLQRAYDCYEQLECIGESVKHKLARAYYELAGISKSECNYENAVAASEKALSFCDEEVSEEFAVRVRYLVKACKLENQGEKNPIPRDEIKKICINLAVKDGVTARRNTRLERLRLFGCISRIWYGEMPVTSVRYNPDIQEKLWKEALHSHDFPNLTCRDLSLAVTEILQKKIKAYSDRPIKTVDLSDKKFVKEMRALLVLGVKINHEVIVMVILTQNFELIELFIYAYLKDGAKLSFSLVAEAIRLKDSKIVQLLFEAGIEINLDQLMEVAIAHHHLPLVIKLDNIGVLIPNQDWVFKAACEYQDDGFIRHFKVSDVPLPRNIFSIAADCRNSSVARYLESMEENIDICARDPVYAKLYLDACTKLNYTELTHLLDNFPVSAGFKNEFFHTLFVAAFNSYSKVRIDIMMKKAAASCNLLLNIYSKTEWGRMISPWQALMIDLFHFLLYSVEICLIIFFCQYGNLVFGLPDYSHTLEMGLNLQFSTVSLLQVLPVFFWQAAKGRIVIFSPQSTFVIFEKLFLLLDQCMIQSLFLMLTRKLPLILHSEDLFSLLTKEFPLIAFAVYVFLGRIFKGLLYRRQLAAIAKNELMAKTIAIIDLLSRNGICPTPEDIEFAKEHFCEEKILNVLRSKVAGPHHELTNDQSLENQPDAEFDNDPIYGWRGRMGNPFNWLKNKVSSFSSGRSAIRSLTDDHQSLNAKLL